MPKSMDNLAIRKPLPSGTKKPRKSSLTDFTVVINTGKGMIEKPFRSRDLKTLMGRLGYAKDKHFEGAISVTVMVTPKEPKWEHGRPWPKAE